MAVANGAQIVNLAEFDAAVRAAVAQMPGAMIKGLKDAGAPLLAAAVAATPSVTGLLRSGYKLTVRKDTGSIINRVPYAMGAEYGQRGKWKGFTRYGPSGSRFATRAVDERADQIESDITSALYRQITLGGWAL